MKSSVICLSPRSCFALFLLYKYIEPGKPYLNAKIALIPGVKPCYTDTIHYYYSTVALPGDPVL